MEHVFVLSYLVDWEGATMVGVYTTKRRALAAMVKAVRSEHAHYHDGYVIHKMTVDDDACVDAWTYDTEGALIA